MTRVNETVDATTRGLPAPGPPMLPRARKNGSGIGGDVEVQVREDRALYLRMAGWRYREIAQEVGYANRQGAHGAVQRALGRVRVPDDQREHWRDLHVQRQEALIQAVWPAAMAGDVRAVTAVRGVLDSQSRMLGLNAEVGEGEAMSAELNAIIEAKAQQLAGLRAWRIELDRSVEPSDIRDHDDIVDAVVVDETSTA